MKIFSTLGLWLLICGAVDAHSVSDAYLTLTGNGPTGVLYGQWDIALRDLDFVLDLDRTGEGRLTWGDVRDRRLQIESYAYSHLRLARGPASTCNLHPLEMKIDEHADGAYAALTFEVICPTGSSNIGLAYDLFFGIDPSHRAIFVMRSGSDISTSVLAPQNSNIVLH